MFSRRSELIPFVIRSYCYCSLVVKRERVDTTAIERNLIGSGLIELDQQVGDE